MNRVFEPGESIFFDSQRFRYGWPGDFRRFMFWAFAATSVFFFPLALYRLPHPHFVSLLRSVLVGPFFEFNLAALSGLAAWTIWKAHPSARGWAIGANLLYLLMFVRPFFIPMRPVPDRNLISLILGIVGLAAFAWPDRK